MERKKGLTVGAYGRPCSHWPGPKLVLLWLIQRELQFWWSASSLIQTLKTWAVSKVFWPSCRIQMFLHCKANFTKLVMRFKLLFYLMPAKLRFLDLWQSFRACWDHFHHFCRLVNLNFTSLFQIFWNYEVVLNILSLLASWIRVQQNLF